VTRRARLKAIALVAGILAVAALVLRSHGRWLWVPAYRAVAGSRTEKDVLARYGPAAEKRLRPHFQRAGVAYPPKQIALLGFKAERKLELWAAKGEGWTFIRAYPVLAASGTAGPKLREGDRQVPEGVYTLEYLNPNSSYHLSMKLNYPNAFDLKHAKAAPSRAATSSSTARPSPSAASPWATAPSRSSSASSHASGARMSRSSSHPTTCGRPSR